MNLDLKEVEHEIILAIESTEGFDEQHEVWDKSLARLRELAESRG